MSKKEATREEMVRELLAALELLRAYSVKVQLKVVGEACWVRLTVPPDPAPGTDRKAATKPPRQVGAAAGRLKRAAKPAKRTRPDRPPAGRADSPAVRFEVSDHRPVGDPTSGPTRQAR